MTQIHQGEGDVFRPAGRERYHGSRRAAGSDNGGQPIDGGSAAPWGFSTDLQFHSKLDWMARFVREHIPALEQGQLGSTPLRRDLTSLQRQVKSRGLVAAL